MNFETSRFGQIQVEADDLIHFSEGLVGFETLTRFVLVDDPTDDLFVWLQSCERPEIAFPLLEPQLFLQSYDIHLSAKENADLEIRGLDEASVFNILTIPQDPTLMTANLKAPVVINSKLRKAKQCVLQDHNLQIREPIFSLLQQRFLRSVQAGDQVNPKATGPKSKKISRVQRKGETSRAEI